MDTAYQGGIWQAFVGNLTAQMQSQLDLFTTGIMTDPTMTAVLLYVRNLVPWQILTSTGLIYTGDPT